jgi:hypothetical protein
MSAVHASTLLTVWDEAVSEPPVKRALSLLSAAWPQTSRSEWACMPIGARDAALLDLQDGLFGSDIEATADCPKCGERAEISFTTSQIRTPLPSREALTLARDEYEIEFRVPTTEDLLDLPDDSPEAELLARCIHEARVRGQHVSAKQLPAGISQAIVAEMSRADPQAEIGVSIDCPVCAHRWSMDFDITSYVWTELDDWARRLLREIHSLASAYGWSERDILEMSPRRRRLYAEMVER